MVRVSEGIAGSHHGDSGAKEGSSIGRFNKNKPIVQLGPNLS